MRRGWPLLPRSAEGVALAAQAACLLEVSAAKPGNVHRTADFADTCFEDFLLSAAAIGPAFARAGQSSVGQIVWDAVNATRKLVGSNTNLGMVLLLAPLAKACTAPGDIRANLTRVLAGLTVEDARWVYAAIRLAQPGGLGQTPEADVREVPNITLREAMALSQAHDAIAREYVSDFAITFEIALPALTQASASAEQIDEAIVQGSLMTLARVPDTLIGRKRGAAVSAQVSEQAAEVLQLGGVFSAAGRQALAAFDRALRDERHTLNPGTTADLIAAAIFLYLVRSEDGGVA